MQSAMIVGGQVMVMGLLTLVGVYSRKMGYLNESSARGLSTFLLNVSLPGVMISSIYRVKEDRLLIGFGLAFVLGVTFHLIGVVAARLLVKKREGYEPHAERFAIVFANAAYMAIPLIRAALGEEATFYATAIITVFLTFHWTYGIAELGGGFNIAKLTKNPCIISIVLGLLIFWFQIPLPTPIIDTVRLVGGLTTPLSMIIAGIFLSDLKLSDLCDLRIYRIAIIRNIIVPIVFIGVILLTGCAGWFESARIVAIASVYSCSCASAVSVILMSAALGKEATHAAKLVAISTIMSLVTLPLLAAAADMLIK